MAGWEKRDLEVEVEGKQQQTKTKTRTKTKGKVPGKLNPLDVKILGLLEVWGALGLGQIEGACSGNFDDSKRLVGLLFNDSTRYAGRIYLRLRGLEDLGLIAVQREILPRQVYRLTMLGHAILRREGRSRLDLRPRRMGSTILVHHTTAAAVGLVLERFLGLEVVSERQFYERLWKDSARKSPAGFYLPDLILHLPKGYGRCMVEVEMNQKATVLYEARWGYYRKTLGQKDKVLYLTPQPSLSLRLLGIAERCEADFLYAADLDSFREELGRALFLNYKGQEFRL